jgi:hypothetical protein
VILKGFPFAVGYFALLFNLIPELLCLHNLAWQKFLKSEIWGFLFENANTESIDKKWCATNMLPIPTPLQVLRLK